MAARPAGSRAAQAGAVGWPSAGRAACAGEGGDRTARPPRAARRAAPLGQAPSGGGREQRRAPRAERATPLSTTRARTAWNWATSNRRGGGGTERRRGTRSRACAVRHDASTSAGRRPSSACRLPLAPRSSVTFLVLVHRHAPHRHGRGGGLEPAATSSEHCAAGCCQVDGPFDPRGGYRKVTDTAPSARGECPPGAAKDVHFTVERGRRRASCGASRRVLAASCSSPPRTPAQAWKRCGLRASF